MERNNNEELYSDIIYEIIKKGTIVRKQFFIYRTPNELSGLNSLFKIGPLSIILNNTQDHKFIVFILDCLAFLRIFKNLEKDTSPYPW